MRASMTSSSSEPAAPVRKTITLPPMRAPVAGGERADSPRKRRLSVRLTGAPVTPDPEPATRQFPEAAHGHSASYDSPLRNSFTRNALNIDDEVIIVEPPVAFEPRIRLSLRKRPRKGTPVRAADDGDSIWFGYVPSPYSSDDEGSDADGFSMKPGSRLGGRGGRMSLRKMPARRCVQQHSQVACRR